MNIKKLLESIKTKVKFLSRDLGKLDKALEEEKNGVSSKKLSK